MICFLNKINNLRRAGVPLHGRRGGGRTWHDGSTIPAATFAFCRRRAAQQAGRRARRNAIDYDKCDRCDKCVACDKTCSWQTATGRPAAGAGKLAAQGRLVPPSVLIGHVSSLSHRAARRAEQTHLEELEGDEAVVGGGLGILVTWPGRVRCRLAGTGGLDRAAPGWFRCRHELTRRDRVEGNLEDG